LVKMEPRSFRRQSSNSRIRSSPTVRGTRRLAAGWDLRGELQRSMRTAGDDVRRTAGRARCAASSVSTPGHHYEDHAVRRVPGRGDDDHAHQERRDRASTSSVNDILLLITGIIRAGPAPEIQVWSRSVLSED